MAHILIATIVRDIADCIPRFRDQLASAIALMPEHTFSLSIYENDSIDATPRAVQQADWSFVDHIFIAENIAAPSYGSVANQDRVERLALARNRSIFDSGFLDRADWVLVVDADMRFDPSVIRTVIEKRGAEHADIYSAVSVTTAKAYNNPAYVEINDLQYRLYDTWATRRTPDEQWGDFYSDHAENAVQPFWTTMNGVCLFRASPFRNGVKFTGFNRRLNTFDCEPAALCEDFRTAGYDKIYVNQSLYCFHDE